MLNHKNCTLFNLGAWLSRYGDRLYPWRWFHWYRPDDRVSILADHERLKRPEAAFKGPGKQPRAGKVAIRDPVPGKYTFLMHPDFSCFIKEVQIHFVCVKVDTAIKFVLLGIKSHLASSFGLNWLIFKTIISCFRGGLK